MNRERVWLKRVIASAIALSLGACEPGTLGKIDSQQEPPAADSFGSLSFNLTVANDQSAGVVDYSIVAVTSGTRREGSTRLADLNAAVDLYFGGLLPDHYKITLSTQLLTGESCSGSQTVWVGSGQPVDVRIVMLCGAPRPASGGIDITGEVVHPASCKLSALFVTLDPDTHGVSLSANAESESGTVSYLWEGLGTFDQPGNATTKYACAPSGGAQHVQLTIQDAQGCSEVNGVNVDCDLGAAPLPSAPDAATPVSATATSAASNATDGGALPGTAASGPITDAAAPNLASERCAACEASACAAERTACDASAACRAVESCIYRTECIYVKRNGTTAGLWDACFCGLGANIDACYFDDQPAVGPCVAEITQASGASDNLGIGQDYFDDTTALGLAGWLQFCQANSCGVECGYP